MSRLAERGGRVSKAFCDGVQANKDGAAVGDNPFVGQNEFGNAIAWQEGFYAHAGAAAWVTATAYEVGQLVVADTDGIYACVQAGTSSVEPSGDQPRQTDGTVVWQFMGRGTDVNLGCCGIYQGGDVPYKPTHIYGEVVLA